jgi:hypothetical protein
MINERRRAPETQLNPAPLAVIDGSHPGLQPSAIRDHRRRERLSGI